MFEARESNGARKARSGIDLYSVEDSGEMSRKPMRNGENAIVHFGEFTLDFAGRCLRRKGQRIRLTPKPFETLAFLVAHCDQTIEKQQLLDAVWKDAAVTEGALVQAIREVRRVLEDDDKEPRYIQTIPRVGYRFIEDVRPDVAAPSSLNHVAPATTRAARSTLWPWALGIASILAGFASWLGQGRANATHSGALPSHALWGERSVRQLTSGPLNALKPEYSPDGKSLLYLSPDPDSTGLDLFVMPAGGGKPRQLTKNGHASGDRPVFTADGTHIVFSRIRSGADGTRLPDLWIIPSSGGTPSLLLAGASGAGFSPGGTEIAYTKSVAGRKALWVGLVGKAESHRQIADPGFFPRWSPDGRWIAYTTSDPNGGSGHLWIVPAERGEPMRLTSEAEDMFGLVWARDGQAVFIASDRDRQGVQLRRVPVSGGPATLVTAGVGYYVAPTVSPDGRTIAFSHVRPYATLKVSEPVSNPEERRLGAGDYHLGHLWPRFSPSGRRIASIGRPHEGERLWITDADTGQRLRVGDRFGAHPDWLDDDRVAYLSAAEGLPEKTSVYVMDVESGASSKWIEINSKASWLAVHPNKRTVAFVSTRPAGGQEIVLRDLGAGSEKVIATGGHYEALRWRPDGLVLAWSGPGEGGTVGSNGIWILEPERHVPRQVVKDGYSPAWSANGAGIYFARPRGESENAGLWRYDVSRGEGTRVRSGGGMTYFDVVGDRLVIASNDAMSQVFEMRLTP